MPKTLHKKQIFTIAKVGGFLLSGVSACVIIFAPFNSSLKVVFAQLLIAGFGAFLMAYLIEKLYNKQVGGE